MMTCEKCEQEMQGSSVRCLHCGHNHVLQRIDAWRERRNQQRSTFQRERPEAATIPLRTQAKDSTLIRFPKRPTPPPSAPPPAPPQEPAPLPAWRQRLDARLKEIREQRAMEIEPPAAPRAVAQADRNPIVASALNRIQRANYLQPITPPPASRSAAALELAPQPIFEPLSEPLHTPPRIVEAKVSAFAPAPIKLTPTPLLETSVEAEMSLPEASEDLLSEVLLETPPPLEEKTEASGIAMLEAASLAKRAAAAVIDAEIIAFSLLPLFAAYFFLGGWLETPAIYTPVVISVLLIAVYFFLTYALAGRTMGMAFLNLHLASHSSSAEAAVNAPPSTTTFTFRQAALRALGGTITLLLFPLNVICIAKSDDRLSLSDSLSGTQVVRIKK